MAQERERDRKSTPRSKEGFRESDISASAAGAGSASQAGSGTPAEESRYQQAGTARSADDATWTDDSNVNRAGQDLTGNRSEQWPSFYSRASQRMSQRRERFRSEGDFSEGRPVSGSYGSRREYTSESNVGSGGYPGSQFDAQGRYRQGSESSGYEARGYEGRSGLPQDLRAGGQTQTWRPQDPDRERGRSEQLGREEHRGIRRSEWTESPQYGGPFGRQERGADEYGARPGRGGDRFGGAEGSFDREAYYGTPSYGTAGYGLGYQEQQRGRSEATGRRSRWRREALKAGEIMTKNPKSVTPRSSLRDVAQIMRDENTGVVPVTDESGRLQGLVTDRDIVMRSLPEGKNPVELKASDVMTDDVEAVTPEEEVKDVINLMGDKQIRRVPVVDRNDRLLGIISMADVATRADFDEDLQGALEDISSRRSFWSRLFS